VAGDGAELLRLVAALRPEVVLADIRMPPTQTTEGLEAALEIRRRWPGTAVIVLSQHVETEHLALMAEGRSNQAIAGQLFMSPKTVETRVGNLFAKLGLLPAAEDHRRVLAVLNLPASPGPASLGPAPVGSDPWPST
jgi:DNA-binding NarL/FixJ family response regulator